MKQKPGKMILSPVFLMKTVIPSCRAHFYAVEMSTLTPWSMSSMYHEGHRADGISITQCKSLSLSFHFVLYNWTLNERKCLKICYKPDYFIGNNLRGSTWYVAVMGIFLKKTWKSVKRWLAVVTEMIFPCPHSHISATKASHDRVINAGFPHRESSVLNEEGQWKFPPHFRLENFLNDQRGFENRRPSCPFLRVQKTLFPAL